MRKQAALIALLPIVGILTTVAVRAQQPTAGAPSLTPMDYIEIKQLVVRSAYAMDTSANNGYAYADLFTPDGEFVRPSAKGRDQLAALARGGARGPAYAHQYLMNYLIQPSPAGAIGKQYVIELDIDDDPPSRHLNGRTEWEMVGIKGGDVSTKGGHYEDAYVKTAQGWRFKKREFFPSQGGLQAVAPPSIPLPRPTSARSGDGQAAVAPVSGAPFKASALTATDYIEIEQLVANYGYALDSGADEGHAYANNFAPDGVVFGRIKGHDAMVELERRMVVGPQWVRHFLTNMLIEPTADGGVAGKNYLVVIDIPESGKAGSIYIGGHYEDTYVKTPKGWRFKTRTLVYSKSGPTATEAPSSR